jgi:hypothetical protein
MGIFRTKSYKGRWKSLSTDVQEKHDLSFFFFCVRYQSVYLPAVGLVRSGRAI